MPRTVQSLARVQRFWTILGTSFEWSTRGPARLRLAVITYRGTNPANVLEVTTGTTEGASPCLHSTDDFLAVTIWANESPDGLACELDSSIPISARVSTLSPFDSDNYSLLEILLSSRESTTMTLAAFLFRAVFFHSISISLWRIDLDGFPSSRRSFVDLSLAV